MAFSGYLSLPVLLWNLAMHVTMIVVLFNILSIKKWAVYAFGGIQIINVAVLTLFFRSDFFRSSFVAVLLCLLLAVLFCLKKDGVSAWRLFFPKIEEKEDDEHACVDEIESVIEEKDVEETFVPELSVYKENEEKKIRKSKTSMIQDDDLFKSLETLPLKEDGSIDYEQMSTIQQFAYTYKTESLQVALKDLNADIKVLEKSIAKVKKELSSLSGGNRAKLRDSLREEQAKLEDLYGLRDKYSVKKKWNWIYVLISVGIISCIVCSIYFMYQKNRNIEGFETTEKIDVKNNKTIHKIIDTKERLYSFIYEEGYDNFSSLEEFMNYITNVFNRKKLVKALIQEGYDNFKNQLELDTYLGYESIFINFYLDNKSYSIPISVADNFEKDNPSARIDFVNKGKVETIHVLEKDYFISQNSEARPHLQFKFEKNYNHPKRRLLYYSLLATGYLSENELGSITDFLNSINNTDKLREFYFKLINWGFFSSEFGSETEFCDNLSTDFNK